MVDMYYSFQQMWSNIANSFATNFPQLLWAIIWLIIGLLVGKIAGWIVKQFLIKIELDKYIFEKDKFKMKLSDIFSVLTRWIIYLLFILFAVGHLSFVPELAYLITKAIEFLAGAVESTVIIIIGYSFAYYIKDKVMRSKTFYGDIVGNIIFFLILYVSIALALPFIGINTELINWILIVIVASFGLGMAIALGLGLKDVVRDIGRDYAKELMKKKRVENRRKRR